MVEQLQANNVEAAFSSVLAVTFGSSDNAPGSVYSPQLTDLRKLQTRFSSTAPEHIKAIYDMSRGNYTKTVQLLAEVDQKETHVKLLRGVEREHANFPQY